MRAQPKRLTYRHAYAQWAMCDGKGDLYQLVLLGALRMAPVDPGPESPVSWAAVSDVTGTVVGVAADVEGSADVDIVQDAKTVSGSVEGSCGRVGG